MKCIDCQFWDEKATKTSKVRCTCKRPYGIISMPNGNGSSFHCLNFVSKADWTTICVENEEIEAIKSESLSEIKDYPELMQIYEGEFDKTKPEKSKVFSIRIKLTETEAETNEKIEQLIQKVKDYRNLK